MGTSVDDENAAHVNVFHLAVCGVHSKFISSRPKGHRKFITQSFEPPRRITLRSIRLLTPLQATLSQLDHHL